MSGTCKTCVHWCREQDRDTYLLDPVDPDTFEPMETGFEVRECWHPKLLFCERPLADDGFAICDGSGYMARLITAENFGCAQWSDSLKERERHEEDERLRYERENAARREPIAQARWLHQFRSPKGTVLGQLEADAEVPVLWRPPAGTKGPIEYWLNKGDGWLLQHRTAK